MVDVKQVDRDGLKAAFDSDNVAEKNIALRRAYNVIDCLEARIAELERERDALTQHRPQCSCVEVYGEDPHCIKHGRGTDWAKENPDICQLAEKAARATAAESRLASYDALVEALRRWNDWYRKATADDDCEYLNSDAWPDAAETWNAAADALKKVGR